ncbi:MAG: hypothetical protein IKW04_01515 [Clostridia bacterium]|nr:hypothetical protein [Clostridia bacterium]
MKQIICIFLMLGMMLSFAGCANKDEVSMGNPEVEGESYGIDLMGEGIQPMSEELATADILRKTAEDYLEGIHIFTIQDAKGRTYADIKDYIGVDATEFQYRADFGQRIYTWRPSDAPEGYLTVTFCEINGQWVLLSAASSKLEKVE